MGFFCFVDDVYWWAFFSSLKISHSTRSLPLSLCMWYVFHRCHQMFGQRADFDISQHDLCEQLVCLDSISFQCRLLVGQAAHVVHKMLPLLPQSLENLIAIVYVSNIWIEMVVYGGCCVNATRQHSPCKHQYIYELFIVCNFFSTFLSHFFCTLRQHCANRCLIWYSSYFYRILSCEHFVSHTKSTSFSSTIDLKTL